MSTDTTTPAAEKAADATEADKAPDAQAADDQAVTGDLSDTQPDDAPAADAEDQADGDDQDDTDDAESPRQLKKLRAENRSLRDRAKTAEAAVTAMQQQAADQAITAAGLKPPAVWAVTELADVLGEDGSIDDAKLSAAMSTAKEQLGVQPRRPAPRPGAGSELRSGSGVPLSKPRGFAGAFAPRRN